MPKYVYFFGDGKADGKAEMRNLLGGKGANLAEMTLIGLPVPAGFTLSTDVCTYFYANGRKYPSELKDQVLEALQKVEKSMGAKFGDTTNPLLLACRSGARDSMPGMMDTVLNIGLNDTTVQALIKQSGNERFALDSYRRLLLMFGEVVMGLKGHPEEPFEHILEDVKHKQGVKIDNELSVASLKEIITRYKEAIRKLTGKEFPTDPYEQVWSAIGAVFGSWMNDRACVYRRQYGIPDEWGTACNIMAMVFGNLGDDCATGVALTRDGSLGAPGMNGDYLINAQGEDVVNGSRPTKRIEETLGIDMPEAYKELVEVGKKLEKHYRNMQDIEFTISRKKLYMLQTRNAKRTTKAALKVAVDMAEAGLITRDEAILRIDPMSLDQLLHPTIDPQAARDIVTVGLPASPGAATGQVVFTSEEAERLGSAGESVILVRDETSPEDIHGMHAARGIVTARGGMTSHAAVVARGMGRPCVSGAGELQIDAKAGMLRARGRTIRAGELVTIDGSRGEVLAGAVNMIEPELTGDFATLMGWADAARRLKVRANAETPLDARTARQYGAEGIGLCRTEHMFFDGDRIAAVREMILADDEAGRRAALAKILPMQRNDFVELFTIMEGLPVTIRLLDPPLHEFLPHTAEEVEAVAAATGLDPAKLLQRAKDLQETNPMLGHRGCRLGVSYPEIYEMQVRAIIEAALEIAASGKAAPTPEIMHPLVAKGEEMKFLRELTDRTAKQVMAERGRAVDYLVGTMVELPRAALRAADLAEYAEFFSFGTNDLTQTTFGISRDDSARFLGAYVEKGIFEKDPFVTLDIEGVGDLIRIAAERGRAVRPGLKLGICGEHGGDPASIAFCESVGLDYVSCSAYRTPIARLAAAQAALAKKG
jgi:pyruvate,orthophosphate dikinase